MLFSQKIQNHKNSKILDFRWNVLKSSRDDHGTLKFYELKPFLGFELILDFLSWLKITSYQNIPKPKTKPPNQNFMSIMKDLKIILPIIMVKS